MRNPIPLLPVLLAALLPACSKEPGEGGKALIRGHVYAVDYNDNTGQPTGAAYYMPECRVYIRYGDGEFYDDDVRTGPSGEYEFRWLRPGDYTVFTYSECPMDCDSGVELVSHSVHIGGNRDAVDVPDLNIENW